MGDAEGVWREQGGIGGMGEVEGDGGKGGGGLSGQGGGDDTRQTDATCFFFFFSVESMVGMVTEF